MFAGMTTARAYLRVSFDRSGRERSNAEQDDENRSQWPDFTWGEPYSDARSASLYSKRRRDDFDRLVADLRTDRFGADVLVLWEASRGSREVEEWAGLINLCKKRGVRIAVTTHGRIYDCSNPRDRRTLQEDAVDSEYESAKISDRVRRSTRRNAVDRKPHGKLLYGYRRTRDPATGRTTGQEPDPAQAPVVAGVFADFLAGQSITSIAARLRAEGGRLWRPVTIRRMLENRAYLGHRIHNGEDMGQGWPAIVDEATFEAAAVRLESISWRRSRAASSHLCSGVARCGVEGCGGKLYVRTTSGQQPHYGCMTCYGAYRRAADLDAFVTAAVLERLALPDVGEALSGREDPRVIEARARANELRAELDEAMSLWKAKKLSVQAYAAMEADLLPAIEGAERTVRQARLPLTVDVPGAEALAGWWDGLTPEVRREVVAALIVAVVVDPTGRGRRHIDWLTATRIEWRR